MSSMQLGMNESSEASAIGADHPQRHGREFTHTRQDDRASRAFSTDVACDTRTLTRCRLPFSFVLRSDSIATGFNDETVYPVHRLVIPLSLDL